MFKVKLTSDTARPDVELMRAWLHDILWNIAYHEREMKQAALERAAGQILMTRCRCKFTAREAQELADAIDRGNESEPEDTEEIIKRTIGNLLNNSSYHEQSLSQAQEQLDVAKTLMKRGDYSSISIDEISLEEEDRANK